MRSSQWCWRRLKSSGMLQLVHSLAFTKYTGQVIFTKLSIHLWSVTTQNMNCILLMLESHLQSLHSLQAGTVDAKFIYNGRAPFSNMTFTLTNRNGQMKLLIWLQLCSVAIDTPLTVWPNSQLPALCCLSAIYSSICHVLHCCHKGLCTYNLQQPNWSFWATVKR